MLGIPLGADGTAFLDTTLAANVAERVAASGRHLWRGTGDDAQRRRAQQAETDRLLVPPR